MLTQGRVLLVNEAQWKVASASVEIEPALTVQGWQDDKAASLIFQSGDRQLTIDAIATGPPHRRWRGGCANWSKQVVRRMARPRLVFRVRHRPGTLTRHTDVAQL